MPEDRSASDERRPPPYDLDVKVAWLYYVEGLTQEEVARAVDLSRAKVIRILADAREAGIVRIDIAARGSEQVTLERRLVSAFGLQEAIVVPAPADEDEVATIVGHAAAAFLGHHVRDGMSIGVGWGATLHRSVKALAPRRLERVSVVSLLGGMTHSRAVNPSAVARRIADALGADCFQLTAPLVVADPAIRAMLRSEPGLRQLLERARRVDLALVSVGNVTEKATLFHEGLLPRSQLASLRAAGAVGDVLCHFIDAEGRVVDHPANRRMIAVGLEDLARIPRVVIASGGRRKVDALRAAMKAIDVSVLITDEGAAAGLLAA